MTLTIGMRLIINRIEPVMAMTTLHPSPESSGSDVQHPGAIPVRYDSVACRGARTVPSSGLPRGPATLATVPLRSLVCGVWAGAVGPRRVGRCGGR
jgi:hypothetical protein